jgi:regulator of protease activity HflC (stomatin/prohibitin superfamily)
MARQAEAEREKRAKIIAAEGEALAAGELAPRFRRDGPSARATAPQSPDLVEISVDKNSTVIFPAPLMRTIQELGAFFDRETRAAGTLAATPVMPAARDRERLGDYAVRRSCRPT